MILQQVPVGHASGARARKRGFKGGLALGGAIAVAVLLPACAHLAPRPGPAPRPLPPSQAPMPAPVSPTVFAYPERGQNADVQARDRYECHEWAARQSGFDPSLPPNYEPERRVYRERGPAPGEPVVAGAVTGAVLGAVVSAPRHTGSGAAVGAVAGAVLGAAAESANENARRVGDAERAAAAVAAQVERNRPVEDYRRAITACLQARGYRVQ